MSAKELAEQMQPGSVVHWDRIERAAFAAHPSILGRDPKVHTRLGNSLWNLIWGIPLVIVYLFCYTAPVWGTAAISVSRFQSYQQDPEQRIPLSGVMFSFALVLLVVNFVRWLVKRRRPSGFYQAQAALALILGGLSALAVRMYGERDSVESWHTWILPILAATILGGIFLVCLIVARVTADARQRSNSAQGPQAELPRNKLELLEQRRERAQQLSEAERGAIEHDLGAAITELNRRGLISEAEANRARDTELGGLGLRMAGK